MEGDTPSFLGLIPNGLNAPEHPEWGGWGGRYILADSSGAQGLFSDAADWVVGINNETYLSQFATIWRWRRAYQYDFAARMQWTTTSGGGQGSPNRQPVPVVNSSCGTLEVPYALGESVVLDASESWDPDGDEVSFEWFHYREPTFRLEGDAPRISPNVTFEPLNEVGSLVNVTPNNNKVSLSVSHISPFSPRQLMIWLYITMCADIAITADDAHHLDGAGLPANEPHCLPAYNPYPYRLILIVVEIK